MPHSLNANWSQETVASGNIRSSKNRLVAEEEADIPNSASEEDNEEESTLNRRKDKQKSTETESKPRNVSRNEEEPIHQPISEFPEWTQRDIDEELFFYPEDTLFLVRDLPQLDLNFEWHCLRQDSDGFLALVKVLC